MLRGMATGARGQAPAQATAAVSLVVGEEEFLVDRAVQERTAAACAAIVLSDADHEGAFA